MAAEIMQARDRALTLTERVSRYWTPVRYEDLPPDTVRLAKRFLIDTLAAGIAGSGTAEAMAVLRAAKAGVEGAAGSGVVWGHATTLPPPQAAMVNGTSTHALELDDFGGCGHPGAVVVPVVCALAGRGGVSGKHALVAMIAGYDLAARVLEGAGGYRSHNESGWHSTATCGSFGAACASAKLLGLDASRFADALGIAGTFTGGTWAFLADGAMTKRFHPGKAAETGLCAALLAQAGMTGPHSVLEAQWGGFFSTYARGSATPDAMLKGFGHEFRIARSGMKPYACCRNLHATLDALFGLMREARADSSAITAMIVHGDAQVCRQFDRPRIGNLLDAQFSMQYVLAVGAVSGRATLDQFLPSRAEEPEVKRLMSVIKVVADRTLKISEYSPVEILLADGRRMERQVQFAKGAPENPLSDAELHDKAMSLIRPVLGTTQGSELLACAGSLEAVSDLRELTRLLIPSRTAQGDA